MKTQTTLQSAIGKPLTGYAESYGDQILLIFGDEYVCLAVRRGYERGEEEIAELKLDLFDFGDEELVSKGVFSQEEMKSLRAERDAQRQRQSEALKFAAYQRMRAKFEASSDT